MKFNGYKVPLTKQFLMFESDVYIWFGCQEVPVFNHCAYLMHEAIIPSDCRSALERNRSTRYIYTFSQMKRFYVNALSNRSAMISTQETCRKRAIHFQDNPVSLWQHLINEYHFSYSSALLFWSYTFHTELCSTRQICSDIFHRHRESQSGNLYHNIEAGIHRFHSWCCCRDVLEFPELLSWNLKEWI